MKTKTKTLALLGCLWLGAGCTESVETIRAEIRELACRTRHADCADAARYRAVLNAHCVDGRSVHDEEYLTAQLRLCDDEYRNCY